MPSFFFVSAALAAASPEQIERGFDLYDTGRPEAARDLAAGWLRDDPDDIAAHRLYILALSRGLRDAPAVEQAYRAWVAAEPDRPTARVALAIALQFGRPDPGPWCDEIDGLIEPVPADQALAYWALRARYEIRRTCPGDRDADRDALLSLGEVEPAAWGYRLRLLSADDEITAALRDELIRFWDAQPHRLNYALNPWQERFHGEGLEGAQAALLARARAAARDTQAPDILADAITVLRWASDDDALADAQGRLAALAPGRQPSSPASNGTVRWAARSALAPEASDIYRAARESRPRARRKALLALDEALPADGPVRALWWEQIARAEAHLGDDAAAAEAWAAAWRADPTDTERARKHGWAARDAEEGRAAALDLIDEALASVAVWDARGAHYADSMSAWLQEAASARAELLEIRGELLRELGRLDEARDALAEAVLLADPRASHVHIRLARVCAALGDREAALAHFGLGYANGDLPALLDWWPEAAREARALYAAHRWSPTGFEGWIASVAATLPAHGEGASDRAERRAEHAAWVRGQPFPDLALLADGEPDPSAERTALSDIEGVRVVDLWATWCGPCIVSLPGLDEKAQAWSDRGVTFLAVSVDEAPQDVIDWLDKNRRHRSPAYTRAWAGPSAMADARVTGIPAVFVLDAEGQIYAFRSGSGYDHWLDEQLAALVGEE